MTNPHTALDLSAITAKEWADPADFPEDEFARATEFYEAMRTHDDRLLKARAEASGLIEQWTGRVPRDVGSFGTRLNLETSDLDLGIGFPVEQRDELMQVLMGEGRATFLGERKTSFSTTRLVFSFEVAGIEIDLSALTELDFAVACRMLDQIADEMTQPERIAHTWVKHLLRASGRLEEYAAWKLVTYARYCPEFNWVPIPEKTGF
ncbi:hypothetical protein [Streptomyces sp. ME19-01-6]|uniref:hypothetical protein n=1 Tax=Streptomyces sp. ME19-01-6 TaxID=3028686 RepID=UPI0029AB7532|nr:hypothetical protein [Streptomyces sp. ME19-01-6]MDX3224557.1 hypothetical protein [Streptomyces sp. ME19-01-6]